MPIVPNDRRPTNFWSFLIIACESATKAEDYPGKDMYRQLTVQHRNFDRYKQNSILADHENSIAVGALAGALR